jgi:hypothetical protein
MKKFFLYAFLLCALSACHDHGDKQAQSNESSQSKETPKAVSSPQFNADSAYYLVQKQVDFGPRVPNTKAHDACARYLEKLMRRYANKTEVQTGVVKTYNGLSLNIRNIIGYINPDAKRKVLLCAHWDSRPWADEDSVRKDKPIDAANDAGSGVAVLLEMAREMKAKAPEIGVIILLVDAEDYGVSQSEDSYALGTQLWAKSLDKSKYNADYGILLDMVGAPNARFLEEKYSMDFAPHIVNKVWTQAQISGAGQYFIVNLTQPITDDHLYVNRIGMIPTIDIVDYDQTRPKGFGDYWHTHKDNMKIIDKNTLKAVGQTLLDVIYNEKEPVQ